MTEYTALVRRWEQHKWWLDYRAALICSVMANVFRGKEQRPIAPEVFMPRKRKQVQPQDMLRQVTVLNTVLGGKVLLDGVETSGLEVSL